MTTKAELQKQFDEWVDQGKQLKEQIDALPDDKPALTGRWKPKDGEKYWLIDLTGGVSWSQWDDCTNDRHRYALGNTYRTEEEAQAALDQQLATVKVLDRIAELNSEQGWVCDFNCDNYESKWYVAFHHTSKKLMADGGTWIQFHQSTCYGSKQTIETVIKEMESDCLLMLGVEV
jgi:hypothetical protein